MRKLIIILGLFLLPTLSLASTYGSDWLSDTTPTVDTYYNDNSAYSASKLIDGNTATYWLSKTGLPHWARFDVHAGGHQMGKLIITKVDADYSKTFSLKYSDNGTDWTELYTDVLPQTDNTEHTYIIDDTTNHEYWKIDFTDAYNSATYSGLREIQAFECTNCYGTSTSTSFGTTTASEAFNNTFRYTMDILIIAGIAFIVFKLTYVH